MKSNEYDSIAVGARVKKARERLHFTQEYISEKIGVGTQHISDIECGTVGISVNALIKLCESLEVTSDYILFGNELSGIANVFNEKFKQLSEKEQLFLENLISFYIKNHPTKEEDCD